MATKKQEAASAAFVLCAGSFDGVRQFPAGAVIEGVPAEALAANAHWLDAAPEAVAHAQANGAPVVPFAE